MAPKKSDSQKQLRTQQLTQIEDAIPSLEERIADTQKRLKRVALLDSVSLGLYEEIDKLARKSPDAPLTELAVTQANDLIAETKELLAEDAYIQRLNQFVPAGDSPPHRDAVVVLRQIRQGLSRAFGDFDGLVKLMKSRLREAKTAAVALELSREDEQEVSERMLKDNGEFVSSDWLTQSDFGIAKVFNFGRLDRTNIQEYFGESK